MRLITGDECGLLKECIPELSQKGSDPKSPVSAYNAKPDVTKEGISRIDPDESQTRQRGVIDMAFLDQKQQQGGNGLFSFATLRKNGILEIWSGDTESKKKHGNYSLSHLTKNLFAEIGETRPLGVGFLSKHRRICAGDMLGNIVILNSSENAVVSVWNAYSSNKRGSTISYTPGTVENAQLATAIAFDSVNGRIAVGGRERETSILDVSTGQLVFKAKNLPPDPQTLLQQPVWPTALQFLGHDSNVIAVGTAYKQVRLYDVREGTNVRRPTSTTPDGMMEFRVTSLCPISDHDLVVGDSAGYIYSLDLRRLGRDPKGPANKDFGRYVGPAGSVRQLKKHPTLPRLAAVGLDRMLRIYDTKSRSQLNCMYLKQRLNCVLFHDDDMWGSKSGKADDEDFGNASFVDLDDADIDQDDIVHDYIDSEEDDQVDDDAGSSDSDAKYLDDDGGATSDANADNDIDNNIEDTQSESDLDEEKEGSGDEHNNQYRDTDEENVDDHDEDVVEHHAQDDADEVVVIKAAKRRRRK